MSRLKKQRSKFIAASKLVKIDNAASENRIANNFATTGTDTNRLFAVKKSFESRNLLKVNGLRFKAQVVANMIQTCIDVGADNALYISGAHPKLGSWTQAIKLNCENDITWFANLDPGTRDSEFKFLIGPDDLGDNPSTSALIWEHGHNRQMYFRYFNVYKQDFNPGSNLVYK